MEEWIVFKGNLKKKNFMSKDKTIDISNQDIYVYL